MRQAYYRQRADPRCLPMRQTSLQNLAERANHRKNSRTRSHRETMTDRLALHPPTRCSTLTAHHLKAIPTTAYSLTAAHLKAIPMAAYSVTTAHLRENQMTGRLVWADRLMEKQTMDYFFQPHLLDLQR